jgi:hypothetical protein
VRDGVFAAQELALEVHGDEAIENRHVEGRDICVYGVEGGVGRVVVQDVEPAERLNRRIDHAYDIFFVGDVDLDWYRRIELAGNPFGFDPVEVRNDNQCAFAGHQSRRCLTYAAPRARDDRDLAVKSLHASSMSVA